MRSSQTSHTPADLNARPLGMPVPASGDGATAGALRSRTFRTLLFSELVSLVGDRLVLVVLVALVYGNTGAPAAVGILMLLKAIPAVALGSLAGALVDRWNRKWVIVTANLVQGLLVLLIPITGSLPLLFVTYFAMSVVNQLLVPARSATIPDLVPPGALMSANSLFGAAMVGSIAIGPAIGGWVAERFGLDAAFYLDSFTFFVPALAVALLRLPNTTVPANGSVGPRRGRTRTNFSLSSHTRAGWAFVRTNSHLLVALAATVGAFLVVGVMSVLGVVVANDVLGLGTGGYGTMVSAMGAGMLAGALLVGRRRGAGHEAARFSRTRLGLVGVLLTGLALALLPLVTAIGPALLLSAVMGLGVLTVQVSAQTTFQDVPGDVRGRVLGISQSATGLAQLLATGLTTLFTTGLASTLTPSAAAAAVLVSTGLLVVGMAVVLLTTPPATTRLKAPAPTPTHPKGPRS